MPPVIAWLAMAMADIIGGYLVATTWVATLIVNGSVMFAAQKLLGKKPSAAEFMSDADQRTQMVRNPVAPRRLIYGRCKASGVMIYAKETGAKREFLHMVVVLASHECDAVLDIFVNDELVPFTGNEPEVGNRFRGFLRVNKHLGTAAQAADADLVAECGPEWTTDHKVSGHAYLAIRVKFDTTVYPSGLPVIAAIVRGMKVEDTRTAVTAWSNNAILCVRHYMMSQYGLRATSAEFAGNFVDAAANVCDELVGLATSFSRNCDMDVGNRHIGLTTQTEAQMDGIQPGMKVSGTGIPVGAVITSIHNPTDDNPGYFFTIDRDPTATGVAVSVLFGDTEARYMLNGSVDTSDKAGDVIEAMLSACGGKAVYAGGVWCLQAGAYMTPTVTLTIDDARGPIQVVTKLPRRDLANYVKGTYVSEANGWVVTDFPQYDPALYLSEDDGEPLPRDVQLPFTTSVSAAQRLAKLELERIRQQILVRMPCKLSALKVQCGDTVMLTIEREGWVSKPFEVVSFILVQFRDDKGGPCLGVDLVLRESAAAVYDWADGADTVVDLAPNTTLHNPFLVEPPTALVLLANATTSYTDNDGAHVPRLKVSWTAPDDQYVLQDGKIRIQYKRNADADWLDWTLIPGDQVEDFITDVKGGVAVDVRIRSESRRGAVSAWVQQLNYVVSGDLTATDPVTGLSATALPEAIRIDWTLPDITVDPNKDLDFLEVYELGAATPAPGAGTAATFRVGKVTSYVRSGVAAGATGYYWVRTVDESRNKSAWVGPVNATAQNGAAAAIATANTALTNANTAITSANGKNTNFYQSGTPTAIRTGDTWFKIGTDEIYNWNGSSWVQINLKAGAISGQLSNSQIADLAAAKLTGQITTTQITDSSITTAKVNAAAISTAKIAASAVTASEIAAAAITSTHISTNQIITSAANIADAIITSAKIVNLDAGKIAAGNITVAIALTSGSITAASGTDNQTVIDSSGLVVGAPSGNSVELSQYSGGAAGVQLRNASNTLKGFFVHQSGFTTLDGGNDSGSAVQNFKTISATDKLKSLSSSNPRTTDSPLYSAGGAYIGSDLDVIGSIYCPNNVHTAGIVYTGAGSNRIWFNWNAGTGFLEAWVDSTKVADL